MVERVRSHTLSDFHMCTRAHVCILVSMRIHTHAHTLIQFLNVIIASSSRYLELCYLVFCGFEDTDRNLDGAKSLSQDDTH